MLRLAGTNALATVAFALIYAAAGARWLTQGAFLASLAVFFILLTALWVHVERSRPGARGPAGQLEPAARHVRRCHPRSGPIGHDACELVRG